VKRAAAGADRDPRWIARENLRKHRLERLDSGWGDSAARPAGLS
jgi:hypothetical protein